MVFCFFFCWGGGGGGGGGLEYIKLKKISGPTLVPL